MSTATATPIGFVVRRRERARGARWKKIAVATSRAEALALMTGSADFSLLPISTPEVLAAERAGLQPAPAVEAFTLWHRAAAGQRWHSIGSYSTERKAYLAIPPDGAPACYTVLPTGGEP